MTFSATIDADSVRPYMPGVPIQLWSVKLSVLKGGGLLRQIVSIDSAA